MSAAAKTYIDFFNAVLEYFEGDIQKIFDLEKSANREFVRPVFANKTTYDAFVKSKDSEIKLCEYSIVGTHYDDTEIRKILQLKPLKKKVSKYGIFASKAAQTYAEEHDITEADLKGIVPSNAGGYGIKDLRSLGDEKKSTSSNGSKYGIFASKQAQKYAEDNNITAEDLKGVKATGKNGYTIKDLKELHGEAPPDKKDRYGGFASKAAQKYAEEHNIDMKSLSDVKPSSTLGYTIGDLRTFSGEIKSVTSNGSNKSKSKYGMFASKTAFNLATEKKVTEDDLKEAFPKLQKFGIADVRDYVEKLTPEGSDAESDSDAEIVKFTTSADKMWREANLSDDYLDDVKPTGKGGVYTSGDIKKAIAKALADCETEEGDMDQLNDEELEGMVGEYLEAN